MIARVAAVLALILGIALGIQTWRLNRAAARELAARVAIQDTTLKAAGWEKAAKASQRELAETVPALQAKIDAAKKAEVPVLAANRTRTETVTFDISVEDRPSSSTAGAGEANSPSSPQPPGKTTPVGVSAEVQTAVAGLDDGTIEWTSRIFATVSWGALKTEGECTEGEPCQTKELPVKTSKTGVAPELEKAWAAWKAPPSYRLDALIGASLGLDGIGVMGEVSGGRGRFGWYAAVDYVIPDPSATRVSGGGRFTLKR